MIPRWTVALGLLLTGSARAQDAETQPETAEEEDPLSPYRTEFDELTERTIGTASMPVEFNWRRSDIQVAGTGTFLFELNNFDSARVGALLRLPSDKLMFEIGLNYAHVWDTPSSQLLALTPYRQPGRPPRMELDLTFGFPLAEGVVTTVPKIFPAVQMVFNGYAGLRYGFYPTGFKGMKVGKIVTSLIAPALSDEEIANLDEARLDAMATDRGRYGLVAGIGNDLYFKQGFFVSPRFLMAIPVLAPASQTDLLVWADFTMAIGVAF